MKVTFYLGDNEITERLTSFVNCSIDSALIVKNLKYEHYNKTIIVVDADLEEVDADLEEVDE